MAPIAGLKRTHLPIAPGGEAPRGVDADHLGQHHPAQVGPYLRRMETECITTVAVEGHG